MGSTTDDYLDSLDLRREAPTLDLLSRITSRHVARHAFASVGPRLGDPLPLAPEALHDRIIVRDRGGYCFEHNGLLFSVLEDLGYEPRLIMARVILRREGTGLTHRVSLVRLDGADLVVDVGFGMLGPRFPVPLSGKPKGSHRVVEREPGQFHLQARVDDDFTSLYRFDLATYTQADAEIGHFYSHQHPEATFVNELIASLILEDEVRGLRGREYRVSRPIGDERRIVQDSRDLQRVLADSFGLQVTDAEADRLFAALPEPVDEGSRQEPH